MRAPALPTRLLALFQLLLALPSLASGSICFGADGRGRLESGFCECVVLPASGAGASLAATSPDGCGPCRDEVVRVLRRTTAPALDAPIALLPLAAPFVVVPATRVAPAGSNWTGEPPGRRLPILRC